MPDHNSFQTCYCTLKDSERLLLQQASHRILQHYNKVYTHLTKHSVFPLSFCFVSFLTCNWLSAKDLQCYLDIPNHQSERPPIDTTSWDDAYDTMWLYIRYTNKILHVINSRPYPLSSFKKYIHKHLISHHQFILVPPTHPPLSLAKGNEALRCAGSTLGITILIDQALPEEHLGPFLSVEGLVIFGGGRMPKC